MVTVTIPGKANTFMGLVLPNGPSLVDPFAAASMEHLEAHTVLGDIPVFLGWKQIRQFQENS